MENVENIKADEQAALQATEEIEKEQEKAKEQEVQQETVKNFPPVTDSDTNVFILSKPFEWENKTYTKLNLDFEKLVGVDMIAIENEMAAHGEYALSPEISTSYLSKLAARAAGVGSDVIEHMPIRDFGKVKNKARDFLLSTGLAD